MMSVHKSLLLIYFKLFTILFAAKLLEGPYKTIVKRVSTCEMSDNITESIYVYPQITNKGQMLLQGNATVQNFKGVKMSLSMHQQNRKLFDAKNMNCHNAIVDIFYMATKLPINKRSCYIAPGTYKFHNIDLNQCLHKFISSVTYGDFEFKMMMYKQAKANKIVIGCMLFNCEQIPVAEEGDDSE